MKGTTPKLTRSRDRLAEEFLEVLLMGVGGAGTPSGPGISSFFVCSMLYFCNCIIFSSTSGFKSPRRRTDFIAVKQIIINIQIYEKSLKAK